MRKIIFMCMLALFSTTLFSCDKEANYEELQLHNSENVFATGDEDNEDDPDEDENKPKT